VNPAQNGAVTAAFRRYGLVSGIDQVTIVVGYRRLDTAGADTMKKLAARP